MKKDTQISELRRDVNRKEQYGRRKQEEVCALQRQRKQQQPASVAAQKNSARTIKQWIDTNTDKMLDLVDFKN